jgi:hypothetical protein
MVRLDGPDAFAQAAAEPDVTGVAPVIAALWREGA